MSRKSPEKVKNARMSAVPMSYLIEQYVADMRLKRLKESTINNRVLDLRRLVRGLCPDGGAITLRQVTPEKVKLYLASRQSQTARYVGHPIHPETVGPLSAKTLAYEVCVLKTFGNWLTTESYPNPFAGLKEPRVPQTVVDVLTESEVETILDSLNPNVVTGARNLAIVMLFLDSGLRVNELATATMADLDLQNRRIKVMGKGSKERFVRFGARCAKVLLRYISLFRPTPERDDLIFLALDGLPSTTSGIRRMVTRLGKSCGIPRLHPHLFRHTFAVNYVMAGGDIMSLKELMGHSTLQMVQRYMHFTQSQLSTKYDEFSPMDRMHPTFMRRFGNKRRAATE
jgi:site-specific recombinase XerD